MMKKDTIAGYTMLEMLLVLTVIGLLIGGVLAGRALIGQTDLQTAVNDLSRYKSAILSFREEFGMYPGDLRDATDYWDIAGGGVGDGYRNSCYAAISQQPKKQTCNGDGNGRLENEEMWLTWQHLANAGRIEGTFSGARGPNGADDAIPGLNAPSGKSQGDGYSFMRFGITNAADPDYFLLADANHLFYGTDGNSFTRGVALSPVEARQIDEKLDDGLPGLGILHAYKSGMNSGCTTTNVADTSRYQTTDGVTCSFIFTVGPI